jgi:hypothetical protein
MRQRPLFSFAQAEDFRGNIFGHLPLKPRGMPKWRLLTIPKGDGVRGIEDLHVFIIARVAGSRPNFIIVLPFKPRPTQTESHGKLIKV